MPRRRNWVRKCLHNAGKGCWNLRCLQGPGKLRSRHPQGEREGDRKAVSPTLGPGNTSLDSLSTRLRSSNRNNIILHSHLDIHRGPECIFNIPRTPPVLYQQSALVELLLICLSGAPHCFCRRLFVYSLVRVSFPLPTRIFIDTVDVISTAIGTFWV